MIVYHGSIDIVKVPDTKHSYTTLDFGTGFYVTSNKEQARRWAYRKALYANKDRGYINSYDMKENYTSFNVKTFPDDLQEWIDFVCRCRSKGDDYRKYDIIIGMVANDRVFRVVDLYLQGVWDKLRALQEIKAYPDYNQIAFISQKAIDNLLSFNSYEEVKL